MLQKKILESNNLSIYRVGFNYPTQIEKGNVMKKFKVKVITSGLITLPKGRKIRTPVLLNLSEKELNSIKVQFKANGLKYQVEEITGGIEMPELPSISKKVIIEELTPQKKDSAEQQTFLDKLISDQENQEKS